MLTESCFGRDETRDSNGDVSAQETRNPAALESVFSSGFPLVPKVRGPLCEPASDLKLRFPQDRVSNHAQPLFCPRQRPGGALRCTINNEALPSELAFVPRTWRGNIRLELSLRIRFRFLM